MPAACLNLQQHYTAVVLTCMSLDMAVEVPLIKGGLLSDMKYVKAAWTWSLGTQIMTALYILCML